MGRYVTRYAPYLPPPIAARTRPPRLRPQARSRTERRTRCEKRARMNGDLVKSWSTTDGVPSQSSSEQAATEHACRALFEEWIDLDGTLHRAS